MKIVNNKNVCFLIIIEIKKKNKWCKKNYNSKYFGKIFPGSVDRKYLFKQ